ncbi:N-ethylmaleimide reductase [Penicillium sp. IBT 18751x]|nr:N-ethylmaleimide reductase [Penicillium sp. IBT 18751x]
MSEYNAPSSDGQFHFVTINNLDERTAKRLARSHAVTKGLANKRKLQRKSGVNFLFCCSRGNIGPTLGEKTQKQSLVMPSCATSEGEPGPFQMLAAESPRLRELLSCRKIPMPAFSHQSCSHAMIKDKSQHTTEPILSVSDELILQGFRSILRKGLDDHALLNAIMLTFALNTTADSFNGECLQYKVEVLASLRQRMTSSETATTESTLGAIVLLAGVEVVPSQVQLHMGAIHKLLDICQRQGVCLSDGIKRAIFWSDLNASVMTGSGRVIDHTTFPELQWTRDPFSPKLFTLPPGFQPLAHLLGEEFVEVLQDVFALQCIRDSTFFGKEDVITMSYIDNHQASIQSRLVSLPKVSLVSDCCHLAAYLCSTMLRCKIWRTSTIPLLHKLQQAIDDLVWNDWPDLLAWLLHIGGAFAPKGDIRFGYVEILQSEHRSRLQDLYKSWPELLELLRQFIWSDKAFMSQVKAFWNESLV